MQAGWLHYLIPFLLAASSVGVCALWLHSGDGKAVGTFSL